ncbi:hypothetical protein EVAR_92809_1 [Eumeta japonica]|uniref:Uncharacterized protein n=1 Tax=Eumeta variegata TaxID=151549 RepID=A0A4C1TAU3_EUMVA|nr:hypothetical protein EVAR_92809_1 [Eumeta japonica]
MKIECIHIGHLTVDVLDIGRIVHSHIGRTARVEYKTEKVSGSGKLIVGLRIQRPRSPTTTDTERRKERRPARHHTAAAGTGNGGGDAPAPKTTVITRRRGRALLLQNEQLHTTTARASGRLSRRMCY